MNGGSTPSSSDHRVDALPRWSPRWWLVLREVIALWRSLLSLRRPGPQPRTGPPVLLIPGFLAGDWTLRPASRFLRLRGFRTYLSGIRFNIGCTTTMVDRLERQVVALARQVGPLALVGHSRGGTLARLVAARRPDLVRRVVTLGSPLTHQFAASHHVLEVAESIARRNRRHSAAVLDESCLRGECADRVGRSLAEPLPGSTTLTSIYSRGDGIVVWRSCLPPDAGSIRVRGSHNGLASSRPALEATAWALTHT
jgi:pimeloyl-ACP methyl ester carboxylesterase